MQAATQPPLPTDWSTMPTSVEHVATLNPWQDHFRHHGANWVLSTPTGDPPVLVFPADDNGKITDWRERACGDTPHEAVTNLVQRGPFPVSGD